MRKSHRPLLAVFSQILRDPAEDRGCYPDPPDSGVRGCFPGPADRDLRGCLPDSPAPDLRDFRVPPRPRRPYALPSSRRDGDSWHTNSHLGPVAIHGGRN